MTRRILHINDFFFPFVSGPSNRILNIAQQTFSPRNHLAITFDRNKHLTAVDTFEGIAIRRFHGFSDDVLHRFIHLGPQSSPDLRDFVAYVRSCGPTCLTQYFLGALPPDLQYILPESRVVYMPVVFSERKIDPLLIRSSRIKVALFGDSCLQNCRNSGLNDSQIIILERPINTDAFRVDNTSRDPFRLLYVGRIHPWKQLADLLFTMSSLFRDHTMLHWHIVGDLNPYFRTETTRREIEKITDLARSMGLDNRIVFRGKLAGKDLVREYSEASIHLLPSKSEMRSTVTQEALTMGLHCINLNRQPHDWPEFRPDGERLIHYVDNLEDFAPTIRNILESRKQPDHREWIEQNWSWHRWRSEYERLLTEW